MTYAYVIQIAGRTAGIVARDHSGQAYRFFASHHAFYPLEGVLFDAPEQAEHAARRLSKSDTPVHPAKISVLAQPATR
jgi:hypothetical protein